MIYAQTPQGESAFLLRGIKSKRGKRSVARASILTATGSLTFWDTSSEGANTFEIEISPTSVSGGGASGSAIAVRTTSAEAAVSGVAGTVSYRWTKTAGLADWSIENSRSKRASFVANNVSPETTTTAEFTCTATDQSGRSASATIDATARNYGSPNGGNSEA